MRGLRPLAVLVAVSLGAGCTSADPPRPSPPAEVDAVDACPAGSVLGCPVRAATASIPVAGTDLTLVYRSDRRDSAALSGLGGWFLAGYDHLDAEAGVVITGEGDMRRVEPVDGAGDELLVPSIDGAAVAVFDTEGAHQRTVDALTGLDLIRYRHEDGMLVEIDARPAPATTIERDEAGRPLAIVAAGGLRTDLSVNDDGWLTGTSDPLGTGRQMAYTDDGEGLLVRVTDGAGAGPSFTYEAGVLAASVDADGVETTWSGDTTDDQTVVVATSPSGVRTTWTDRHDDGERTITVERAGGGRLSEVVGPDGSSRLVLLDGTEVRREVEPDPRWSGASHRLARMRVTTPSGRTFVAEQHTHVVVAEIDPLAVVTATRTISGGGMSISTSWDAGEREFVSTDGVGVTTRARFDEEGQLVELGTDGQGTVTIERDDHGRPTAVEDGRGTTRIAYAGEDASAVITDPLGGQWQVGVDGARRLRSVLDPSGRRLLVERTTSGLPFAVSADGDQVHGWAWTPAGRLAGRSGPYQELVEQDEDGRASTLTSGAEGQVALGYDDAGDLTTIELGTDSIALNWSPDALRLTSEDADTVVDVANDGHLVERVEATGPVSGAVSLTYDDAFRLAALDIAGSVIDVTRDDVGRVTSLGDLALSWDDAGRVATTELGAVRSVRSYDGVGALESEAWTVDGSPFVALNTARDARGRATTETTAGSTRSYSYDPAGHLAGAADPSAAWTYAWDRHDNLTAISGPAGSAQLTYDDRDRLVTRGQTTYTWRDDGVLTGWSDPSGSTTLTVDDLGRTTGVALPDGRSIRYLLDGAGRRVAREVDGDLAEGYLYDHGGAPVALVGADGAVTQRYVRTDSNAPAFILTDHATYRVVSDLRGSPRAVIDVATGAAVQELDYDPLGRITRDTNPGFQPFGFGGGVLDGDTGLVHLGARDYDPATGRFTAPDPSLLAGDQLNPYAFADGDPVNFVDPGGLQASSAGAADPTAGFPDLPGFIDHVLHGGPPSEGVIRGGVGASGLVSGFGPAPTTSPVSGGAYWGLNKASVHGFGEVRHLSVRPDAEGRQVVKVISLSSVAGVGTRGLGALGGAFGIARVVRDLGFGPNGAPPRPGDVVHDVMNTRSALGLAAPWAAEAFGLLFSAHVFGRLVPEAFGDDSGSYGDPHLVTHDGLPYDFQGAGEFVAVTSDDGDFEVQVRQEPLPASRAVTVNTALAVRIGPDRVTFDRSGAIAVAGAPLTDPTSRISLLGGGVILRLLDGRVVVQHADGSTAVHVTFPADHVDYTVGLAPARAGRVHGLLGNADGNPDDDLTSADGTTVEPTTADATEPLYAVFGESWRVPAGGSLFDYAPGTSTDTFTDRTVPEAALTIDDLSAEAAERAEVLCRGGGVSSEPFLANCILDVVVSGDPGYVTSAAAAQVVVAGAGQVAVGPVPTAGDAEGIELGDRLEGELAAGDTDRYAFTDDVGESVLVVPEPDQSCLVTVRFADEDGAVVGQAGACDGGVVHLPDERRWDVLVDSAGEGSYAFTIERAPEPDERDIDVGDEVTDRLTEPGERHEYVLDLDAGDVLFVAKVGEVSCDVVVNLVDPAGDELPYAGGCLDVGRVDVATSGEHRLVVTAPVTFTGAYGFEVLESRPDRREVLAVGATATGTIDAPGARDIWEVDAAPGQQLVVRGVPGPCVLFLRPFDTSGNALQGLWSPCAGDLPFTAPADGQVEIWVFSVDRNTDDYTFRLEGA